MYYADSKKTIEMNDTMIDVFFHYVAILFKTVSKRTFLVRSPCNTFSTFQTDPFYLFLFSSNFCMKPTFSSIALKCKPIIYFLFKFQFNTTTYIVENMI